MERIGQDVPRDGEKERLVDVPGLTRERKCEQNDERRDGGEAPRDWS